VVCRSARHREYPFGRCAYARMSGRTQHGINCSRREKTVRASPKPGKKKPVAIFLKCHRLEDGIPKEEEEKPRESNSIEKIGATQ